MESILLHLVSAVSESDYASRMDYEDETDLTEEEWSREKEGPTMDFLTASNLGNREMVRYHLNRAQDINEQSEGGWTALMYACASHRDDLVWFFLNSGADVGVVDRQGRHFLTVAAENGNVKALRLLRNWMNVIQEDTTEPNRSKTVKNIINLPEKKNGFTPLMFAAQQSNNEMVTLLLIMGADNSMRDHSGRTACELAVLNGHQATSWQLKFYNNFTVRDVLEDASLLKYYDLFERVTVGDLLKFDEEDLKTIGLKLLGPRKKLLLTIEKIKAYKLKRLEMLSLEEEKDHSTTLNGKWKERNGSPFINQQCFAGNAVPAYDSNFFRLSI